LIGFCDYFFCYPDGIGLVRFGVRYIGSNVASDGYVPFVIKPSRPINVSCASIAPSEREADDFE